MVIFHSYVSLPEGTSTYPTYSQGYNDISIAIYYLLSKWDGPPSVVTPTLVNTMNTSPFL